MYIRIYVCVYVYMYICIYIYIYIYIYICTWTCLGSATLSKQHIIYVYIKVMDLQLGELHWLRWNQILYLCSCSSARASSLLGVAHEPRTHHSLRPARWDCCSVLYKYVCIQLYIDWVLHWAGGINMLGLSQYWHWLYINICIYKCIHPKMHPMLKFLAWAPRSGHPIQCNPPPATSSLDTRRSTSVLCSVLCSQSRCTDVLCGLFFVRYLRY